MGWHALGEMLILLVSAVAIAAVLERFRISAVIGYLLGGMIVGPGVLGLVGMGGAESAARYEVVAELGVSLLLFTIGLEITPTKLRLFGLRGAVLGVLQIVVTVGLVMAVLLATGRTQITTAFAIACMVALSSTAVVMRLLTDRCELDAPHGRLALAILLVQDLAVVPMLLVIGLIGNHATEVQTSDNGTSLPMLLGASALILCATVVLPKVLGTNVFRRNRDFPIILALATALVAAWVSHSLGLSAELGAFVAGIALARTEFARQMRADVAALKSVFLALFFASIGMLADLQWVLADSHWVQVIAFCAIGMTLKVLITTTLAMATGAPTRVAVRTGLTIAQIGEFSFVVGTVALARGLFQDYGFQMLIAATILSLLATPAMIATSRSVADFVVRVLRQLGIRIGGANQKDESSPIQGHVVIAGFGPAGAATARAVQSLGIEIVVIDLNPKLLARARAEGLRADLGNSSQREILEHAQIETAEILVVALPDPAAIIATVEQARTMSENITIIARARYDGLIGPIERAGADHVLTEENVIGTLLGSTTVELLAGKDDETVAPA